VTNFEAEWLTKAIQGDQDAFANIVETFQRPVFNLCYRMLGEAQEAEDAAQETFWRAYQNLRRYDPASSANAVLIRLRWISCRMKMFPIRRPTRRKSSTNWMRKASFKNCSSN